VVGSDGYLYLFGTGAFRASYLYLARLPLRYGEEDFPNFVKPYFADTPGLEFYNSNTGRWAANDPANATPLMFDDHPTADLGQVSVRYLDQLGVWLLMYTHAIAGHGAEVVVRWSPSPTGKWSSTMIALDLTDQTTAGIQNRLLYGCTPQFPCSTAPPTEQQAPFTELMAADVYAPDMLPYLTNVSPVFTANRRLSGYNFTVPYLLSSFKPYNSVLFGVDINVELGH
jgi:hypothetical protein